MKMDGRPTDQRNVDLAELHRAVVRGTSNGRIIWQPGIGCHRTPCLLPSLCDKYPGLMYGSRLELASLRQARKGSKGKTLPPEVVSL